MPRDWFSPRALGALSSVAMVIAGCGESPAASQAPAEGGTLQDGAPIGSQGGGSNVAEDGASNVATGGSASVSQEAGPGVSQDGGSHMTGGRPIVVIKNSRKPEFGAYYAEILRTEGISSFDLLELSEVADLSKYQVAIVAETPLTEAQSSLLTDWVNRGGRIVAMRPDARLSDLLGIGPSKGTVADGYLQVSRSRWGVSDVPLQFHGVADLHDALPGTAVEGALLRDNRGQTGSPAITVRQNIGPGGGKAIAVMYDLARSVVYTRQGNPAKAGQAPVLDSVPRASELFNGFLDTSNYAIPQADEEQRLLVNLLHDINDDQTPLPRLWYLPGGRKLAVVMTGDDHNANGTLGFFNTLKAPPYSLAGCSVADWSCARATSWVYSNVTALKNGAAATLASEGFEIGPHVAMSRDGGCASWSSTNDLLTRFTARLSEFKNDYGIAPAPTGRTHCFVFADWDTEPKVEGQVGIRLDENYTPYLVPGTRNRLGRLNGSAMPMRFTDKDGATLDVYQLVSDIDYEYFDPGTTQDQASQAIGAMLDGAIGQDGFWGFIGTHYDYSGGLEAIVRGALLKEITSRSATAPIALISAKQLLDWLDLRNGSSFDNVRFDGQTLQFGLAVKAAVPNAGLEAMIPSKANGKTLESITRLGAPVPIKRTFTVRTVPYAFFDGVAGSYEAVYR